MRYEKLYLMKMIVLSYMSLLNKPFKAIVVECFIRYFFITFISIFESINVVNCRQLKCVEADEIRNRNKCGCEIKEENPMFNHRMKRDEEEKKVV